MSLGNFVTDIRPGDNKFSFAPSVDAPRSKFNRTYIHKTTFEPDYLIPLYVDEVLPGDTINLNLDMLVRMTTPLFPIMDNLYFNIYFFYVPYRLLWRNFLKFMGERKNPDDSVDYIIPQTDTSTGFLEHSLADYFGIATKVPNLSVSALPFRAYNFIFDEWFRDQNLQDSVGFSDDDGPDSYNQWFKLRKANKFHDYFTSALPWPQKGEAVNLPLGIQAPVISATGGTTNLFKGASSGAVSHIARTGVSGSNTVVTTAPTQGETLLSNMVADLEQATAATINALRQAVTLQEYFERDARGGTRYVELVKSHFGVSMPDNLYRPEFLGSSSHVVNVTPIAQTSGAFSGAQSPLASLAAVGFVQGSGNGFVKSFVEHGIVMGLGVVRQKNTYQQGVDRMFLRRTRFDFYFPIFANLGEQAIYNVEVFAQGTGLEGADYDVFGYQERYAEYRYKPNIVTGLFRSNADLSLDAWHLSQEFENLPGLNSEFIESAVPMDRVLAVTDEPPFFGEFKFNIVHSRVMPMFGVPTLGARF